jgi:hypothetical protein
MTPLHIYLYLCTKENSMAIIVIYLIGVVVAGLQIKYWLRDVVVSKEKYRQIMSLCILSWAIYPAYVLDYILYKLEK